MSEIESEKALRDQINENNRELGHLRAEVKRVAGLCNTILATVKAQSVDVGRLIDCVESSEEGT